MSLEQELAAFKAEFSRTAPAGRAALYEAKIEELRADFALASAVSVDEAAPDFALPNAAGKSLDSSLRDVKEDDSNNEVAPSRGGEQIDDVLDGFVGAVVGGFKSAVWAILRVRTAVEAAVGKWSAQPFVEEQKKQRDLNTL
jgi:hypothetical protein